MSWRLAGCAEAVERSRTGVPRGLAERALAPGKSRREPWSTIARDFYL